MSLFSMTGFARVEGRTEAYDWAWELKSLNGRNLDIRLRVPPSIDGLEFEIRQRIAKRLQRGSVNIGLVLRKSEVAGKVRVNEEAFVELAALTEKLAWKANLAAPTVGDLLQIRGIMESGDASEEMPGEAVKAAVLADFDTAVEQLLASRRTEGEALFAIVSGHLDQIEASKEAAKTTETARNEAIKIRLKTQVEALMETGTNFDPQRLHQEAVLLASRMDVREELDRLGAHVKTARDLLAGTGAVGRKLDFLSQEFGREANTLCSKANDLALTRIGLDLKTWVEQFREQVQNIE